MKLEGKLPIPTLTATVLPAIGRAPRLIVVHGAPGWQRRMTATRTGGVHICKSCGEPGHHQGSKRCPLTGRQP